MFPPKILFGIAALFNVAVAAALTVGWSTTQPLLQLAAADGSNKFLINVGAVLVLTFGYAYFMVSRDPERYRPYVTLGIIGKLLVVAVALPVLIKGSQGYLLAWLAMGDLLFSLLFADFLRRRPRV